MANARPVRSSMVAEGVAARQKKSAAVGLALSAGILMSGAPSVAEPVETVSAQPAEASKASMLVCTQRPMAAMKVYTAPRLVLADLKQDKLAADKAKNEQSLAAIKAKAAKDAELKKVKLQEAAAKDAEKLKSGEEKYKARVQEAKERRQKQAEEKERVRKDAAVKEDLRRQKLGFKGTAPPA